MPERKSMVTFVGMKVSVRDPIPDILKGVAVLLMIQVHLTELFGKELFYESIGGKISLFLGGVPAAPLFMFIMGYYAFKASSAKSFKRSGQIFLLGLILNILLNVSLFSQMIRGNAESYYCAYIFGVDILYLAALSLFILAVISRYFKNKGRLIFLLSVIAASLPLILPEAPKAGALPFVIAFFSGKGIWWSYFPLFPWLAYPLAGYALHALQENYADTIRKTESRLIFRILFGATFVAGCWYGWKTSINLSDYYHHSVLFFIWALSAMYWWYKLWKKLLAFWPEISAMAWYGKNVTAFYIVQWVIIGNIATWVYKTQSWQFLMIWFILITIISTQLVRLYLFLRKPKT